MTRKMTINVARAQRGNVLFPAWECFVSGVGINNSPKAHFLRSLLLLLVMMTFGTNVSWGQDLPFVPTTDADNSGEIEETEKHYYMIQSFINSAYYMRPNGTRVNTLNIITDDMKWYFLKAGDPESGVQYYYICDKDGRYMYFPKASGSMSDRTWMELKTDKTGIENNCKFTIEKNNTKGWSSYNIIPRGNLSNYCLNKQGRDAGANGGATKTGDIQVYDGYDDQSSNWFFIDVNDYEWTLHPECFTVSTDETTHYYKIQNKNSTAYYIMPGETYVKTSNSANEDDLANMVWYFKEASHSDYMTYYYIIHAATGRYLRYRGNTGANTSSTELAEHTGSETGEAENRFRFIVARGANANEDINDDKGITFNIVPLLLENAYTNNQYKYYCLSSTKTAGSDLAIEDKRSDNMAHWNFELTTLDPKITCDETGTVTITCEEGAEVYYTKNGDIPTTTETATNFKYNASSKPTVTDGKTTFKARAIKSGAQSNVVTKTIVLNPTIILTADSYTYTGSAQNPVSSVDYVDEGNSGNNINFETTQYTISYKKGDVAVAECKNAGTYTIILNDVDGDDYIVCGTGSFTIGKKALTIKANDKTITYGEEAANNGVTYTGFVDGEDENTDGMFTGSFSYSYNTAEDGSGTAYSTTSDPGTYYIVLSGDLASANYSINFVSGILTVNKVPVTVTADDKEKGYGEADPTLTATVTGLLGGDDASVITYVLSRAEGENAGEYAITPSGDAEQGNYTVTYVAGKLTITGTPVTVTSDNATKVYGDAEPAYTATVTGLQNGDPATVITYTFSRETGEDVNADGYIITPTGAAVQGNYSVTYVAAGKLTITQAPVDVTADNKTKEYGDPEPPYTATVAGLKNGDAANVINYTVSRTEEGETVTGTPKYTIGVTGASSQGNYTVTYHSGKLAITAKSLGLVDGITPAPGITIDISKTNDIYDVTVMQNGNTTLVQGADKDYTWTGTGTDTYVVTVEGKGNYTGSAQATFINLNFYGTNQGEGTSTQGQTETAAAYCAAEDLQATGGVKAYTVTAVDVEKNIVCITEIKAGEVNYIPQDVPVLLLGDANTEGFTLKPYNGTTVPIGEDNLLKQSDGSVAVTTPDYYIFYEGAFVLSMWGEGKTMKNGKFYVHPTESSSSPAPAYAGLRLVRDGTTMVDAIVDNSDFSNQQYPEEWYTLDGQKLNKKPSRKGLYILNGQKVVIK